MSKKVGRRSIRGAKAVCKHGERPCSAADAFLEMQERSASSTPSIALGGTPRARRNLADP
eukprot:4224908-Prymnesium_polylepis.1